MDAAPSMNYSCSPFRSEHLDADLITRRTPPSDEAHRRADPHAVLLTAVQTLSATTYMSVEPIPNRDVVGEGNLILLRSIGYSRLERWSQRLLSECLVVDSVIDALSAHGAITSVTATNTRFVVAAGGFEGATNPSYVFTVQDSGPGAASAADVNVLDNALGYVLNQGGTAHFSADNAKAYAFTLDYAVVTFPGTLSGDEARQFFDRLGTIDAALWSGQFAGFTQIDFASSSTNNSMLFLQPAVTKQRFITGLAAAVEAEPDPGLRTFRSTTTALRRPPEPASPFPAMTGWPSRAATSILRTSPGLPHCWTSLPSFGKGT